MDDDARLRNAMYRILVTDGDYRQALSVVRSLGMRGFVVDVISHKKKALSFYSRYCRQAIVAPHPIDELAFSDHLLQIVQRHKYDVILPVGGLSCRALSRHRGPFERHARLILPDSTSLEIAFSKRETFRYASALPVPMPVTFFPESIAELKSVSQAVAYPVVVKESYGHGSGAFFYASSPEELFAKYQAMRRSFGLTEDQIPIIQEYISGPAYGFFGLFNHGKPRATFMHRRIREVPPSGGPSAVAESIYDKQLEAAGLKILKGLIWHGVAMVEFKLDSKDGQFKLVEINPKFWGSLELAIVSGVDFPYLICKMAVEGDIDPVFEYREKVRFRWLFPDEVLHVLHRPSSLGNFLRDFFRTDTRYDVSVEDIRPTLIQLRRTGGEVLSWVKSGIMGRDMAGVIRL